MVFHYQTEKGFYPENDEYKSKVTLTLLDCLNGNENWKKKIKTSGDVSFIELNDKIHLSDNYKHSIFSLASGILLQKNEFVKKDKSNFSFDYIIDLNTGKYYLKSFDDKIYW